MTSRYTPQDIYLSMIREALRCLNAAAYLLSRYNGSADPVDLDSTVLQFRKALEAIALASIAPQKEKYEKYRSAAAAQADFTKDYHAKRIFQVLRKINKKFYPMALMSPQQRPDGSWHYDKKTADVLTEKRFEVIYDRLGRVLHAANPWGTDPNRQNLAADLSAALKETFELIEIHAAFIQSLDFNGVWVVIAKRESSEPEIMVATAGNEFAVQDS